MAQPLLEDLIEDFQLFDDWQDRYRYLIDLGRDLEPLPDDLKRDEFIVQGCMSQVWLVPHLSSDSPPIVTFRADSDAHIVRGLIAILKVLFDGRTAAEIRAIDVEDVFRRLGLDEHLSPNRRNGFFSMVERLRGLARAAA